MALTKKRGFSLLELTITITIGLIMAAVTDAALQPVFRQQRVNDAYNLTISSLRRARDSAAADMRVYEVTFTAAVPNVNGGTITVAQAADTDGSPVLFTAVLPMDVTYHIESGIPTSETTAPTTPDGFGTGASAFDFDQPPSGIGGSNVIYFYPDGTAEDVSGNINNGVVYMGVIGQLQTQRAVTVWGYTGRIRGWHLYQNASKWTWSQQ
jgi:prepilin-type N-terminal cleavage/methylation domain-containing protein